MRKLFWKSVAIMVTGLLTFTACSPEQSEFTLSDFKTTATVKGQAYYQTGIGTDNKEITAYPEGKKVWLDLNLADFTATPSAPATTKIYETTMDVKGYYSFVIPVPTGGVQTTNWKMRFESFEGQQTLVVGETKEGAFSGFRSGDQSLLPTNIALVPITKYTFTEKEVITEYTKKYTIEGEIKRPVVTSSGSNISAGPGQSSDSVKITVDYNRDSRTYKVKANDGKYTFDVPAKPNTIPSNIKVNVIPVRGTISTLKIATPTENKSFNGYYSSATDYAPKNTLVSPEISGAVQITDIQVQFTGDPGQADMSQYYWTNPGTNVISI